MSDYLTKRTKNIDNQAKDILERPGFIEAVAELTKKWNPDSKAVATTGESESWHSTIYKNTDLSIKNEWPIVRKKITKAENNGNLEKAEGLRKAYNDSLPLNAFRLDIETLMSDFEIEKKWFDGVKSFVLTGKPRTLSMGWLTVRIHEEIDLESGEVKELSLILSKDTTLADIKAIWKDVKYHQSQLPGKSKVKNVAPRNRKRDGEIYKLDKKGISHPEIGKKYGLSYDQVGTILRNYRKRTGKS